MLHIAHFPSYPHRRPRLRSDFIWKIIIFVCLSVTAQGQQLKTYTPEGLLRLEEIGETALSPDGELLAYVVKRAKAAGPVDSIPDLNNNDRADIWLASLKTRETRNLTNGLPARAGYFAPRWSPDGERLAMLSVTDGFVRLMIWTRSSQKLEPLSSDRVDPIALENFQEPYCWGSSGEVVYVADSHPTKSFRDVMLEAWAKLREGRESTASVLDSGVSVDLEKRPQKQLKRIDVFSRQHKTIATAAGFGQILLSPDAQRLAFLKQVGVWQPDSSVQQITSLSPAIYQLVIAELDGSIKTTAVTGVAETLIGSLLWSPDSKELAVIGYRDHSNSTQTIFRCQISNSCTAVSSKFPDLDPYKLNRFLRPPMIWMGTGEILLNSRQDSRYGHAPRNRVPEWWAIDANGNHRRLIPEGRSSPTQILPELETPHLIAVIKGELCLIDSSGGVIKTLASGLKGKITSIVWTDTQSNVSNRRTRGLPTATVVEKNLIAATREGLSYELWSINLETDRNKSIPLPVSRPFVIANHMDAETVGLFADADDGTYIWAGPLYTRSFTPIAATNAFLKEISLPKEMKIGYRSSDGAELTAWIMLPHDYQEGRRYPMVAWVYPGRVFGDSKPTNQFLQLNPFDLRLLAARGYVVLYPSMPLKAYGEAEDPYLELTKGVLPAIDKLVEMGIVDADRVGLMGHSYGGYATYGLITQTNRFRAAVASAGMTNMSSHFGVFHVGERYEPDGHENLKRMWNVETIAMGGPPWKDLGRYLRNSPVNYVERVETPLLIMHGDVDTIVQLEQAEEFFTSLYRQKKRARFVRYFGEGHTPTGSAANIRHQWNEIFSWFDEFLKPASSAATNK